MKRIVASIIWSLSLVLCCGTTFVAAAGQDIVNAQSVRDLADLARKYEATGKLPQSVVAEGKQCTSEQAATCLLSIIKKVLDKSQAEGKEAVPQEDLDRISALREALQEELAKQEGYLTLRESIDKMLAKPEEPAFLLKGGVKGFVRGEGAWNQRLTDFSYNPGHGEGRFLYRAIPYLYWHPTDYLDIHLEGQGYGFTGGSQYWGQYSLYQGYVEGKLPGSDAIALKAGRQEFVYGSAFILGANAFYQGLTFDAARLRAKPLGPLTIDFLGGWYATPWSAGIKGNLAGGYATYAVREGTVIEAYAFNDTGSTNHHPGEYLNIWGLRATAKAGPVSFEIEPVFESGRTLNSITGFNDGISAWGGHADMTVEAEVLGKKHTFFASYAYGSGNREAADGTSARREFRNPDNDTSLTGDMSLIGDLSGANAGGVHASGVQLFNLGWGMELMEGLNFSATGRYFYANATSVGISRRIGLETDFTLTCTVNEHLTVVAGYDRFFTGGFFRDATGSTRDVDYGYLMLQFDISKSKPKLKPPKG
ncbi:MAG TPA: alginate export family protein [Geobacteraceae bacterium]